MTFAITPFGDGVSTTITSSVHNHFGPWTEVSPDGVVMTDGVVNEYSWEVTGVDIQGATRASHWLVPPTLPSNAVITRVTAEVKEAFVLGGTTPTIAVGTDTSETTNGVSLTQAQAQAVGVYVLAPAGTWASPLTADVAVDVALGGTSPTVTNAGRVRFVVHAIVLKP